MKIVTLSTKTTPELERLADALHPQTETEYFQLKGIRAEIAERKQERNESENSGNLRQVSSLVESALDSVEDAISEAEDARQELEALKKKLG